MSNTLIIGGILLILGGMIMKFMPGMKLPLLPGDIFIQKENFSFYFPIATSVIISIILTLVFNIFHK